LEETQSEQSNEQAQKKKKKVEKEGLEVGSWELAMVVASLIFMSNNT